MNQAQSASSEALLENYAKQAYQQSQAWGNDLQNQASQAQQQYAQSVTGANTAQSNLADFTKNMQSGTDIYGKQLGLANTNAGYNVNDLNQAQSYLTQLTKQNAGLPQSIQANNANYGATAGNVASQVGGMQQMYAQGIAGANQSTTNMLAKQAAGLSGAQAATQAGVQTQDSQRQAYADSAKNALGVMQQSQVTMDALQTQVIHNGQLTADQQNIYASAKANYAAAQASYAQASASLAQASYANSQTVGQNLKNTQDQNYMNSAAYTLTNKFGIKNPSQEQISNYTKYGTLTAPAQPAAPATQHTPGVLQNFAAPMTNSLGSAGKWLFGS